MKKLPIANWQFVQSAKPLFMQDEKNSKFLKKRLYKSKSVGYNNIAFAKRIFADIAQAVERILGKDEVASSILAISSKK